MPPREAEGTKTPVEEEEGRGEGDGRPVPDGAGDGHASRVPKPVPRALTHGQVEASLGGGALGREAILAEPASDPLGELADDGVAKLLARHESLDPADFWAQVEALVGELVTTTWSSVGALVEMSAAGVTKATTLELVCAERGITADQVVAFGDMPNDLALLEWAGRGYAMANAHESVLAATEHHAPRHDEDGVAVVLEELFGLR